MSPRPPGRKTSGCWLEWTPIGRGRLCFTWEKRLHRITMDYTRKDERELARLRDLIGAEIRAGVFDPVRRFPSVFAAKVSLEPASKRALSIAERMPTWIEEKRRRKVLDTRTAKYDSHLRLYISRNPFGRLDPFTLTRSDFEAFVGWLVSEGGEVGEGEQGAPLSEKTASNVVRGTVRAFLRDIEADASLVALSKLRWERYVPGRVQDTFTAAERQALFAYFRARSFAEYVSIRLRFEGATPSETRGFNVGDFSRSTSTIVVQRSRSEDLKRVRPTKNEDRKRAIELSPELAADVATLCGVRLPHEPLIVEVYESSLTKAFAKAQIALGFHHRSIYQAKHTYATLELEAGGNPIQVAKNLGISPSTLTKHYAAALMRGQRRRAQETPPVGFLDVSRSKRSVRGGKK